MSDRQETAIKKRGDTFAREADGYIEIVDWHSGKVLVRLTPAAADDLADSLMTRVRLGRDRALANGRKREGER